MNSEDPNVVDLIEKIVQTPALFIGEPNFSYMIIYLRGYCSAMRECGVTKADSQFAKFQEWLLRYYEERADDDSEDGWSFQHRHLNACEYDEHKAFTSFKEIWRKSSYSKSVSRDGGEQNG